MTYSEWKSSFWYTSALTGDPSITGSKLFINPRTGEGLTLGYYQLKHYVDSQWLSLKFPHAQLDELQELLQIIQIFINDMEHSIYRYHGQKVPVPGVMHERTNDESYSYSAIGGDRPPKSKS